MRFRLVVGVIVAAAIVLLGTVKTYRVRNEYGNAQLIWNDREAYLFITADRLGWSGSYGWLGVETFANIFKAFTAWQKRDSTLNVVHVTLDSVTEYTVEHAPPTPYWVFRGSIYQTYHQSLSRWTGSRFEPAAVDEKRAFEASPDKRLSFANQDGWSSRVDLLHGPDGDAPYEIAIGGRAITIVGKNYSSSERWRAFEVQRAGEMARLVWDMDETSYAVSRLRFSVLFQE